MPELPLPKTRTRDHACLLSFYLQLLSQDYYTIVGIFRRLCKTLPTKQLTCSLISTCILPPTSVFIRYHERNAGMFLEWRLPLMFAGGFFSWCQCKWMSSKHRSGHLHCNLIPKECKIQRPKSIIKDHNLYQL